MLLFLLIFILFWSHLATQSLPCQALRFVRKLPNIPNSSWLLWNFWRYHTETGVFGQGDGQTDRQSNHIVCLMKINKYFNYATITKYFNHKISVTNRCRFWTSMCVMTVNYDKFNHISYWNVQQSVIIILGQLTNTFNKFFPEHIYNLGHFPGQIQVFCWLEK